jgi:hypothetical protein
VRTVQIEMSSIGMKSDNRKLVFQNGYCGVGFSSF